MKHSTEKRLKAVIYHPVTATGYCLFVITQTLFIGLDSHISMWYWWGSLVMGQLIYIYALCRRINDLITTKLHFDSMLFNARFNRLCQSKTGESSYGNLIPVVNLPKDSKL